MDGASKVTVEEQPPKVRGIPSAPTSVFGAVGITERGPIGVPTLCSSPDEFEARFGGFIREGDLPLAAAGFYENGGTDLWVVRTAHYRDTSDSNSATARRASYGSTPGAEDFVERAIMSTLSTEWQR